MGAAVGTIAIAHEIVKAHGGSLEVASQRGAGKQVRLTLAIVA